MNKLHINHNILGRYCWTCQRPIENGVPGWPRANTGSFIHYFPWASQDGIGYTESVVWANGDTESKRAGSVCSLCGKNCSYPVGRNVTEARDSYREINKNRVKEG